MSELKKNLRTFKKERIRRLNAIKKVDQKARKEWLNLVKKKLDIKDLKKVRSAYNFAKKLKYKHNNSSLYFSHPLRVTNMVLMHKKIIDCNLVILALNHNILEVSNLSRSRLIKLFDKDFYEKLLILTVNRKLQWNKNYKKKYYKNLIKHSYDVRIIKVMDKLDNLFLIGLNPSKEIRVKYINEIKNYILPIVKKDLPNIYTYYCELVKDSFKIGKYDKEIYKKWI